MKPKPISVVLGSMTLQDFVSAAEKGEREAKANERLAMLEQQSADSLALADRKAREEHQWCIEIGHPEYTSRKNLEMMLKRVGHHPDQLRRHGQQTASLDLRRKRMRGEL